MILSLWLTPFEAVSKEKKVNQAGLQPLGFLIKTFAIHRARTPLNVKPNRRSINQSICNLGVMRDRCPVKAECHIIDD